MSIFDVGLFTPILGPALARAKSPPSPPPPYTSGSMDDTPEVEPAEVCVLCIAIYFLHNYNYEQKFCCSLKDFIANC